MLKNNGVYPQNYYCLRLPNTTSEVRSTPKAALLKIKVKLHKESVTSPPEEKEIDVWFPDFCIHRHSGGAFSILRDWIQKKEEEIAKELGAKLVGIANDGLETIRVRGAGGVGWNRRNL